ncbi:MAG TPA: hypothetical protein VFX98_06685 [Longimicrobiaceae bacterium]|nr:hypothetical protein [Longimicrobiaceae bacterium]
MPRSLVRTLLPALAFLLAAGAAQAQRPEDYDYENLVLSGIGADLYQLFPENMASALALRVHADLGLLGPNVRIVPSFTYWSSELSEGEVARMEERIEDACERGGVACPGIELGEIDVSDLAFEVDAHYLWTTDYGVEPYAGVGLGVHLLNGRGEFIDDTFVEELLDAITPAAIAVAGLELPLGPSFRLQTEARGVLGSNVRYLALGVGATLSFPSGGARPAAAPAPGGRR